MGANPNAAANSMLSTGSFASCATCDEECKKLVQEVNAETKAASSAKNDKQRNKNITQAYADAYRADPGNKWVGLGSIVSAQVGCTMNSATGQIPGVTGALGDGNKTIFESIYPMVAFHKKYGSEKLKKCYAQANGKPLPAQMDRAFRSMDAGNQRDAANQIADYEQKDVASQVYDRHPIVLGLGARVVPNSTYSIPLSSQCGASGAVPFEGNINNAQSRVDYYNKLMDGFEKQ